MPCIASLTTPTLKGFESGGDHVLYLVEGNSPLSRSDCKIKFLSLLRTAKRFVMDADPKTLVEQGYNKISNEYLAWSAPRPTETRMHYLDILTKDLLTPGSSVLELGCGAGVPCTQFLTSRGFAVTANDISEAQIALAKVHVPQATLVQGDMTKLSFKPESFDAVLAFYSIFHLPGNEQAGMVELIKSWLKPGGWLLCNFNTEAEDIIREGWFDPSVRMFSSGLGVEGTRKIFSEEIHGFNVLNDEVAVEKVGSFEEKFHWILAKKES